MPKAIPVSTSENHAWLLTRWQSLVDFVDADRAAAAQVWDELLQRYSESHRAYHNFFHVAAMLRNMETQAAHIRHPEAIAFSVWFHDVIYDPQRKDNEQRSAEWARCALTAMAVDERHIPPVMACIAATAQHAVTTTEIPDLPLFLDLDLAIFGTEESAYRQYAQAIRAEYAWVADDVYQAGRGKVLRAFLDRPFLYFTPQMRAALEQPARRNLTRELQQFD